MFLLRLLLLLVLLLMSILRLVISWPSASKTGQALRTAESAKHWNKIMSLQTTLKTVFGGSRMDMFGDRVPDGRSGDRECSLAKPRPCYDVVWLHQSSRAGAVMGRSWLMSPLRRATFNFNLSPLSLHLASPFPILVPFTVFLIIFFTLSLDLSHSFPLSYCPISATH